MRSGEQPTYPLTPWASSKSFADVGAIPKPSLGHSYWGSAKIKYHCIIAKLQCSRWLGNQENFSLQNLEGKKIIFRCSFIGSIPAQPGPARTTHAIQIPSQRTHVTGWIPVPLAAEQSYTPTASQIPPHTPAAPCRLDMGVCFNSTTIIP